MLKVRQSLLGLTVLSAMALTCFSANAADMYVPAAPGGYKDGPVYIPNTWAGFYVGVNGGYGWSNDSHDVHIFDTTVPATDTLRGPDPAGGFGGGQIGYNWQRDHLVFGVEADIQGADISDKVTTSPTSLPGLRGADRFGNVASSLDWFGTVRGRLGYSFDRALIYATGGFAYGGAKDSLFYNDTFGHTLNLNKDDTLTGYVVGGGVEYKINPAWSVKAEYQYINLGSDHLSGQFTNIVPVHNARTDDIDHMYNTVRVGLNYHIGPSYEPLK
jgi:outer membrane immunogenic protein